MVRVTLTALARAQLDEMSMTIRVRMFAVVKRLAVWPNVSGARALRGELAGHYRIRTGDYRIMFRVEGDDLIIERIGHRSTFYKE